MMNGTDERRLSTHSSHSSLSRNSICVVVVFVQSLNSVWLFVTPWTAACQASLSITISQSLLKLMSIELVMPSNHLILCHPLLLPSIPASRSFPISRHQVAKILELQHQPFNEYPGLISFRIDWFDLLAVQGSLKSLVQHHNSKALILQCSGFFMVQLSHSDMTTGKTKTLTIWNFVSKVMSLLFNMLSRFVIAFLPRSKCLLISQLQSPSAVILEPKKVSHCFHCFPFYLLWTNETGCHDLRFLNVEF